MKNHQTPKIEVKARERTGSRYCRRLRAQGRLPGVIYGHKREPLAVSIDTKEIMSLLQQGTHVLALTVDGAKKTETCLVKDLQFGYLGDTVIHVDFARVDLDEEVHVHVQLSFVGTPASAQKAGAILSHDLSDLEVICRVSHIPEEIKVDLERMKDRTLLTVGELMLPEDVRAASDPGTPVAHVSFVHREEAVTEEVEVVPATTEPEVITEAKSDEQKKKAGT